MRTIRNYGYIPSNISDNDVLIKFTVDHVNAFAKKFKIDDHHHTKNVFDLRTLFRIPNELNLYEEEQLKSSVANSLIYAYIFDTIKYHGEDNLFIPSRLFLYYNTRLIEGTTQTNSPITISNCLKCVNNYGLCSEEQWEYDPLNFSTKPSHTSYVNAKKTNSIMYRKIDLDSLFSIKERVEQLCLCLLSGFPIIFGCSAYKSIETSRVSETGFVPMPHHKGVEREVGGLSGCVVGFNNEARVFVFKNFWGYQWGDDSYGFIPYEYLCDERYGKEFWIIKQIDKPIEISDHPDMFTPQQIYADSNIRRVILPGSDIDEVVPDKTFPYSNEIVNKREKTSKKKRFGFLNKCLDTKY